VAGARLVMSVFRAGCAAHDGMHLDVAGVGLQRDAGGFSGVGRGRQDRDAAQAFVTAAVVAFDDG